MFLPRVPNVACLVFWLKDIFCGIPACVEHNKFIVQAHDFKACNTPEGFELFVRPPSRFLPALSEVDAEESRHRFDYWFSFLCCCPVAMGLLCELIRICVISMAPNSDFRRCMVQRCDTESATESETERLTDTTAPSRGRGTSFHRFCVVFTMYHIFCAGLVTVALCNDWATIKGGGSFSWELWAIWQQLCLWNLFVQNLLRCWREDPMSSLQQSTFMKTMKYTCPVVSELADTLKDWIVTGICLKARPHAGGFLLGGIIVIADLPNRLLPAPPVFPCSMTGRRPRFPMFTSVPLLLLFLWAVFFQDQLVLIDFMLMSLAILCGIWLEYHLCWFLLTGGAYWVTLCLWKLAPELFPSQGGAANQVWLYVSDGGCLFCLSAYTILMSHLIVASDPDAFQDVGNTYRAILSLPKRKPVNLPEDLSCGDRITEKAAGFAMDFCSTGRLLIAWMEDLPQGLIGFALVAAHRDQVGGIGFAAVSAAIGLAKGLLIPTGQSLVLAGQLWRVRSFLRDTSKLCALIGPQDFDVKGFYELSKLPQETEQEFANVDNRIKFLIKNPNVIPNEEQRDKTLKEEREKLPLLREKAKEARTPFMAKWQVFDREVVQQMKKLARQRFNTDTTSSLYTPVHEHINRWLHFNQEKTGDLDFFNELVELLKQLLEEDSTDSDTDKA